MTISDLLPCVLALLVYMYVMGKLLASCYSDWLRKQELMPTFEQDSDFNALRHAQRVVGFVECNLTKEESYLLRRKNSCGTDSDFATLGIEGFVYGCHRNGFALILSREEIDEQTAHVSDDYLHEIYELMSCEQSMRHLKV